MTAVACGGAPVAPDRVTTAAHSPLSELQRIRVGGTIRRAVRVALAPGSEVANGRGNLREDAAIIQLDQPVPGVAPVKLIAGGSTPPTLVHPLGRGKTQPDGGPFSTQGELHDATLKTLSDRTCAKRWRTRTGQCPELAGPPDEIGCEGH